MNKRFCGLRRQKREFQRKAKEKVENEGKLSQRKEKWRMKENEVKEKESGE